MREVSDGSLLAPPQRRRRVFATACVIQGTLSYTQQLHALSLRRSPSRSGSASGSDASAVKFAIAPPLASVTARDTRACSGAPTVGHWTYAKTRA